MPIRYVPHSDIDKLKWDTCIEMAPNGLIFSCSDFLDITTSFQWDALVLNDYEAVMPLPWKKKYGISYIYQPPFTAQTGITGLGLSANVVEQFIKAIPPQFRYIDVCFNYANLPVQTIGSWVQRNNFLVSNSALYNENTKRNIQKAITAGVHITKSYSHNQINEYLTSYFGQIINNPGLYENTINKLFSFFAKKKQAILYTGEVDDQLHAFTMIFFWGKRAYYLLAYTKKEEAKSNGASHLLVDAIIQDCMLKGFTLDFEGSDIEGVARFYKGFGAVAEPYFSFHHNRLPRLLKWSKK